VTKDEDPAFLTFLAEDIESHPEKLRAFPPKLAEVIADLTSNVDCDCDEPIVGVSPRALAIHPELENWRPRIR
jgi:hypothetical protein